MDSNAASLIMIVLGFCYSQWRNSWTH